MRKPPPGRQTGFEARAAAMPEPLGPGPAKAQALSAEELLSRAQRATTTSQRARIAERGLAHPEPQDATTRAMLLRQLYLARFEERQFAVAKQIAVQMIACDVLPDVAHQDAARAAMAMGEVEEAVQHLRLAARTGPASRRAFHYWSLGSVLFMGGRNAEARHALSRALRWGTSDKPLYAGHIALVEHAMGGSVADLRGLREDLEAVPAGQGYGRFVLGHLAYYDHDYPEARRHLEAFVQRSEGGRAVVAIALEAEIAFARRTLSALRGAD